MPTIDLENLTKKWWFYLLLFLIAFMTPPYTAKPVTYMETGELVITVLREAFTQHRWLAPVFHIATTILIIFLWKFGEKIGQYFYAYLAGNYIFMAFASSMAVTEKFGFVVISSNLFLILFVGFLWILGIFQCKGDFESPKIQKWRLWAIPLAILAFWFPINELAQPNFNPLLLLTSDYGIAFCPTTPVMVFILTLYHPNIYKPAYRVLCVVGTYFGILNVTAPLTLPGYTSWLAILHVPLLTISIYGLMLEKMKYQRQDAG